MESTQSKDSPTSRIELLFFSGLAADGRIFAPQLQRFPQLKVATWPQPDWDESLDDYGRRLMDQHSHGRPLIMGGASFGGLVAQRIAQTYPCQTVLLFGSVRRPDQLPIWVVPFRPMAFLVRFLPIRLLQWLFYPISSARFERWLPLSNEMLRQFCQSDPLLVRWSIRQILLWKEEPVVDCPVYQIHGSRDWLLPIKRVHPDRVVPGGHVLTLSHPEEVNAFIQWGIDALHSEQSSNS